MTNEVERNKVANAYPPLPKHADAAVDWLNKRNGK